MSMTRGSSHTFCAHAACSRSAWYRPAPSARASPSSRSSSASKPSAATWTGTNMALIAEDAPVAVHLVAVAEAEVVAFAVEEAEAARAERRRVRQIERDPGLVAGARVEQVQAGRAHHAVGGAAEDDEARAAGIPDRAAVAPAERCVRRIREEDPRRRIDAHVERPGVRRRIEGVIALRAAVQDEAPRDLIEAGEEAVARG